MRNTLHDLGVSSTLTCQLVAHKQLQFAQEKLAAAGENYDEPSVCIDACAGHSNPEPRRLSLYDCYPACVLYNGRLCVSVCFRVDGRKMFANEIKAAGQRGAKRRDALDVIGLVDELAEEQYNCLMR